MGGFAAVLHLQKGGQEIGEGELYYTLRDFLLDGIFSRLQRPSSRELRSYLDQEEVFTHGSDMATGGDTRELLFAFDSWGEGQDLCARLAAHCCEMLLAHELEAVDGMVRAEGDAVQREQHLFGRVAATSTIFVVWPEGRRHVCVSCWWPTSGTTPRIDGLSAEELEAMGSERRQRVLGSIMSGWCGCELCQVLQVERGLQDQPLEQVPAAWASLEADPVGARLAHQVASELGVAPAWAPTQTSPVLADWLHERGTALPAPLLLGLAWTWGRYRRA
jgi:hypothetical protein